MCQELAKIGTFSFLKFCSGRRYWISDNEFSVGVKSSKKIREDDRIVAGWIMALALSCARSNHV